MIAAIMGTDMAHHFEMLSKLKTRNEIQSFDKERIEDSAPGG